MSSESQVVACLAASFHACHMRAGSEASCSVHESLLCCGLQGVEWGESLPPVLLLHGTADTCALVSNATQFDKALEEAGAQVSRQDTVRRGQGVFSCMPPALACSLEKPMVPGEGLHLPRMRLAFGGG